MQEVYESRNGELTRAIFIRILLPALAAGASANIASMLDGIIVGNAISSVALAAVNSCRPASQIYAFLAEILASGLANCIAHAVGRNDNKASNGYFTTALFSVLIAATVLTAVQFVFSVPICRFFANNDELYPLALQYYRVFLCSVFFILINETLAASMRTDGYSMLSAMVLLLPHIVNSVLNLMFVSVFKMGLSGVAIATVLGYVSGTLIGCYYLFFKKSYHLVQSEHWKNLTSIVSVGMPPALNKGLISIKLLIINSLALAAGGTMAMAIMSLIMVAWALESLFIGGVKQSMLPMISFYYANGDYHGVRSVFRYAFRLLMSAELVLILLFEIFPQILPLLFGMRETEQIVAASVAIRIFAISMPMEAFIMLAITYYTSIRKKKIAVLLSVLQGLFATAPVIYPLVHFWGVNGVWLSYPVAGLIPLAVLAIICSKSAGGFFCMNVKTYLKEFSVDCKRIPEIVDSVIKAVREAGYESTVANRTGLAIEEMAVSTFERNKNRKVYIDVTVCQKEDSLLVTFADNGCEFDPLQYLNENNTDRTSNIAMLKAISEKMEYGRVVGMNKTDVTLK